MRALEMPKSTDEALLGSLQRAAFEYFLAEQNPANGLIADNSREGSPSSIAVVGFALSVYPIAVERGWLARADAVARSLAALRFFRDSDQSGSPEATGHKGFYYHFLDLRTGKRVWLSELSMVDTALLIAGALTASMYFTANTPEESELRDLADMLYRRIDWRWAQDGGATIEAGLEARVRLSALRLGRLQRRRSFSTCSRLGSPTHPLRGDCYEAWTATYQWENLYGHDFLYGGPLFVHQFSHAWIDFRGIRDRFMREKRCDYFENSRRATLVQREYAQRNPRRIRRVRRALLGTHRLRWAERRVARRDRRAAAALRLRRARRAVRTGRWHDRSDGRRSLRCRSRRRSRSTPRAPCKRATPRCSPSRATRAASIRVSRPPMIAAGFRAATSASIRGSSS